MALRMSNTFPLELDNRMKRGYKKGIRPYGFVF